MVLPVLVVGARVLGGKALRSGVKNAAVKRAKHEKRRFRPTARKNVLDELPEGTRETIDARFRRQHYDPSHIDSADESEAAHEYSQIHSRQDAYYPNQYQAAQPKQTKIKALKKFAGKMIARVLNVFIYFECSTLFAGQVLFWLIGMIGLFIEAGYLTWAADVVIDGMPVFFGGTIAAAFCGYGQLYTAFINYFGKPLIHPFRGVSLLLFIFAATMYMLPFVNVWPWGIHWTRSVARNAGWNTIFSPLYFS